MKYTPCWVFEGAVTDSLNNCQCAEDAMVGVRMSRRARRLFKKIQRANSKYSLQELASGIQTEVDKRLLSYDEALMLGNMIQNRADQVPGDSIVYAISDRDAYRRTLECTSEMPC